VTLRRYLYRYLSDFVDIVGGIWRNGKASQNELYGSALSLFMAGWGGIGIHCTLNGWTRESGLVGQNDGLDPVP
jgi:hypothetical protein